MTNKVTNNETFYTTPKMAAMSISGDVVWQIFTQLFDPEFEDNHVGSMAAIDFMGIFYPFFICSLIYGASRAHSRYWSKKQDEEGQQANLKEDKEIGWAVFLGMAGWMSGYYLADDVFDFGRWSTATLVGLMSALPLLAYSKYNDKVLQGKDISPKTYAVAALSFFVAGFSWYLCCILPGEIPSSEMPNDVSRSFISPYVTALASGASLGILYLWEKSQAPKESNHPRPAV